MDGIGGCIKNVVLCAVLSGKVVIQTPFQFVEYAQANLKGVTCIYMPESAVLVESDKVENTPYVAEMCTLQVNMVRRQVTKARFWCLQFFKISYSVAPCGHFDLADDYNAEETCALCLLGETG